MANNRQFKIHHIFKIVFVDLIFFIISFLCAYVLRNSIGHGIQPIEVYIKALPIAFLIMVIVFYFFGLYEQKIRINGMSEVYTVTKGILMTAVLFMAASFLYKYDYSRGFVLLFVISAVVFLNIGRFIARKVRRILLKKGIGIINVLIIGAGKPARRLAREIEKYKDFGYKIIGFLDGKVKNKKLPFPLLGSVDDLIKIIEKNKVGIVFVSDPAMPHEKMLEMMADCEHLNVKFKLVSSLFEIVTGTCDINEVEGIPAIDIRSKKQNFVYFFVKRLMDILLSACGLVLFSPLWLIIVIAIRLDSPGKAHFVHERVGKDGKIFKLYKFRTMKDKVNPYERAPLSPNDPRITKVGRFLRRTSLDELPQLINVLKGDMSLVGPRPEMPFIVRKYNKWQKKRLEIKPGLTGLWQILGRKDLPLHENIEYDFYYLQNQSLILDFVILVKTIAAVVTGKGAF
jgi:exopolysaccharide biosynthesis polyprenyl glycosylphosphotransferase